MIKGDKRTRELNWDRGMPIAGASGGECARGRSAVITRIRGGFRAHVIGEGGAEVVYRLRTEELGPFLAQLSERPGRPAQDRSADRDDDCDQTIVFAVDHEVHIGTPTPPPPDPIRPADDRLRRALFFNVRNLAVDLGRLTILEALNETPDAG